MTHSAEIPAENPAQEREDRRDDPDVPRGVPLGLQTPLGAAQAELELGREAADGLAAELAALDMLVGCLEGCFVRPGGLVRHLDTCPNAPAAGC